MTLSQLLASLKTAGVTVTIKEAQSGDTLVELLASGFESLDDAIESREVAHWVIDGASHITVLLKSTETGGE